MWLDKEFENRLGPYNLHIMQKLLHWVAHCKPHELSLTTKNLVWVPLSLTAPLLLIHPSLHLSFPSSNLPPKGT